MIQSAKEDIMLKELQYGKPQSFLIPNVKSWNHSGMSFNPK